LEFQTMSVRNEKGLLRMRKIMMRELLLSRPEGIDTATAARLIGGMKSKGAYKVLLKMAADNEAVQVIPGPFAHRWAAPQHVQTTHAAMLADRARKQAEYQARLDALKNKREGIELSFTRTRFEKECQHVVQCWPKPVKPGPNSVFDLVEAA
jgi:hypothetical protein